MAEKSDDVRFFSETDLKTDAKGNISRTCDYPRWYFPKMIHDLKEEIRSKKFSIETGRVAQARLHDAKQSLAASEKQLAKLEEATPDFADKKDLLVKVSIDLGSKISATMPSRGDMQKGLDDPQRLVKTDTTYCIDVSDSPKVARLADINGFRMVNKKLRGGDAMKLWQLSRAAVGEDSNTEHLRRD